MKMKTKRPARRAAAAATISDQLRAVILNRKLTPYSVAVSAGVAPSVVTRFINGERGLTLDTLDRVAGALGLRLIETSGRGIRHRQPAREALAQEQHENSMEVDPQPAPNHTSEKVRLGVPPLGSGAATEQPL
jgi:transcriptional regulator with XRE-family HTH domain